MVAERGINSMSDENKSLANHANEEQTTGAGNSGKPVEEGGGVPAPETTKPEETVTVPKSLLEQLINDVQDLKTGRRIPKVKRVHEHTARVKVIEISEKHYPVTKILKTWVIDQGKTTEETHCQIEYKNAKGEMQKKAFVLMEFLNNNISYNVKILSQEAKEEEKFYGMVRKINADPVKMSDDGKGFTPGETESIVRSVIYTSKVKFLEGPLEGKELTIANEWLNI